MTALNKKLSPFLFHFGGDRRKGVEEREGWRCVCCPLFLATIH